MPTSWVNVLMDLPSPQINGRVADCVLFLPKPISSVVIDFKFPKESFHRMTDFDLAESDRRDR